MRSLLGGLTIGLSNLEMFLVTKTYPGLVHSLHSSGVFYLYSASCMGAALWVCFLVTDSQPGQLSCAGNGNSSSDNEEQ